MLGGSALADRERGFMGAYGTTYLVPLAHAGEARGALSIEVSSSCSRLGGQGHFAPEAPFLGPSNQARYPDEIARLAFACGSSEEGVAPITFRVFVIAVGTNESAAEIKSKYADRRTAVIERYGAINSCKLGPIETSKTSMFGKKLPIAFQSGTSTSTSLNSGGGSRLHAIAYAEVPDAYLMVITDCETNGPRSHLTTLVARLKTILRSIHYAPARASVKTKTTSFATQFISDAGWPGDPQRTPARIHFAFKFKGAVREARQLVHGSCLAAFKAMGKRSWLDVSIHHRAHIHSDAPGDVAHAWLQAQAAHVSSDPKYLNVPPPRKPGAAPSQPSRKAIGKGEGEQTLWHAQYPVRGEAGSVEEYLVVLRGGPQSIVIAVREMVSDGPPVKASKWARRVAKQIEKSLRFDVVIDGR